MTKRYLLIWFVLALIAVANGILRETTYGKTLSELTAHQLSTVTGIIFSGVLVWFVHHKWPIESASQAWLIGLCWLLMTLIFEFSFGHFIAGHSWQQLFSDYNILSGRVWLLFLVWILLMPYLFYRYG